MKLAYLTQIEEESFQTAARIGYDCLEVHGKWETEQLDDPDQLRREADAVRELIEESGVGISAIALFRPGFEEPEKRIARYSAYIRLCEELDLDTITTLSGAVEEGNLEENLDYFESVFSEVAPRAEEAGVKIAFENWPGLQGTFPPIHTINFAYSPDAWERMFELVDSPVLGLEFDPSHLVWQGIEWAEALDRFSHRIHHAHAKDTEVFRDQLSSDGFFSAGWWRYRLPGYGCVDWHKFTSMLKELGYEGTLSVEHEDPVFMDERWNEGLQKAHDYLRPLV